MNSPIDIESRASHTLTHVYVGKVCVADTGMIGDDKPWCEGQAERIAHALNCLRGIPTATLMAIAAQREDAGRFRELSVLTDDLFIAAADKRRAEAAAMVPVNAGEDDPPTYAETFPRRHLFVVKSDRGRDMLATREDGDANDVVDDNPSPAEVAAIRKHHGFAPADCRDPDTHDVNL